MVQDSKRRLFIKSMGVAAVGGLAGCSNDGSGDGSDGDDEEDDGGDEEDAGTTEMSTSTDSSSTGTETDTPADTESTETETASQQTPEPVENPREAINDWLGDAENYDGNIEDLRSEQNLTVDVGATRANLTEFDPPAARITLGTEVRWLWTGNGGRHNVVERNGQFDSGDLTGGGGATFIHTFEEPGVYLYRCGLHGSVGGRGAFMVEEQRTLTGYPQVDNWLENNDFDGRLVDGRNQSQVTIKVGADGNGGNFAYDPNAILVSQGTDVVFDWTGRGGIHDVSWDQGEFSDSEATSSAAKSYSVTMDEPGVYLYFCRTDRPGGGRGAVVVQ